MIGGMRYAIDVPNFGDFAEPEVFIDLAVRAEQAGWDGLFVWDHVVHDKSVPRDIADPWILLAAAAAATARIRLGPMLTPVARRRVAKLAREVTTLDRLSHGRTIFGAGLGAPLADEFGSFGEPTDPRLLAARLDEGLAALDRLWSGERVDIHGEHVTIDDVTMTPTPVQRPRVPVWLGGYWPRRAPMRRAARWDGAVPLFDDGDDATPPSLQQVRDCAEFLRAERGSLDGFDLMVGGRTPDDAAAAGEVVAPYADAGATWWSERTGFTDRLGVAGDVVRRVEAGPPLTR